VTVVTVWEKKPKQVTVVTVLEKKPQPVTVVTVLLQTLALVTVRLAPPSAHLTSVSTAAHSREALRLSGPHPIRASATSYHTARAISRHPTPSPS
jgi:hypothetical protein